MALCLLCLSASGDSDCDSGATSSDSCCRCVPVAGDPDGLDLSVFRLPSSAFRLGGANCLAHNVAALEAAHAYCGQEKGYRSQHEERDNVDIGRRQSGNVAEGRQI